MGDTIGIKHKPLCPLPIPALMRIRVLNNVE